MILPVLWIHLIITQKICSLTVNEVMVIGQGIIEFLLSRDCSVTRAVPYISNGVNRSLIPYKRYTPQTYNSFKRSWGADDSLGSFMHQFSLSSVPSKRLMPMSQIPNLQADFSGNDMHLPVFLWHSCNHTSISVSSLAFGQILPNRYLLKSAYKISLLKIRKEPLMKLIWFAEVRHSIKSLMG